MSMPPFRPEMTDAELADHMRAQTDHLSQIRKSLSIIATITTIFAVLFVLGFILSIAAANA